MRLPISFLTSLNVQIALQGLDTRPSLSTTSDVADTSLNITWARDKFPSLDAPWIFADNAAGSQVLWSVINGTTNYFNKTVYPSSAYQRALDIKAMIDLGDATSAVLYNAENEEVGFGPTTTQLLANLAKSMIPELEKFERERGVKPHIVYGVEHDANVAPWENLARDLKLPHFMWQVERLNPRGDNPYDVGYKDETLLNHLTKDTKVVSICGSSNILGEEFDIAARVKKIRDKVKALGGTQYVWVVIDVVGQVPHGLMDVKKWDVDFACLSFYKLFGPHTGALYASKSQLPLLDNLSNIFAGNDSIAKLLPGANGYELTYASSFVLPYLVALPYHSVPKDPAQLLKDETRPKLREDLTKAYELIYKQETELSKTLLDFLTGSFAKSKGVKVVGGIDPTTRSPTICFLVDNWKSQDFVQRVNAIGATGIRWGNFLAYRMIRGLDHFTDDPKAKLPERFVGDGVIRISLVHYNTVEEVNDITQNLTTILNQTPPSYH